ncbi:MAG: hypothetical protein LBU17_00150 [Treponema sp.]|jgi:hypothetical protein|nr:hypothetical protein [Treponema sp.]
MVQTEVSKISCAVDVNVIPLMDEALKDLGLPEVLIQRAKQVCLIDRFAWFGLRPATTPEETRACIYRFRVPLQYEAGVMRRIAEAVDLFLPGRGSIYAETITMLRGAPLEFDEEKLSRLCTTEAQEKPSLSMDNYAVLCCIVQRGMASSLAATVLEMGLCVPLISFGRGLGLRDRLGLLRVTIPVEKEVLYLVVPRFDAELIEGVIVHKARLDLPGQGFLYRRYVRALTVNIRVRRGKRRDAATMEQVIAALDQLRGSSDWRRLDASRQSQSSEKKNADTLSCLSLITDEGSADIFGKAAMDTGAGGATLIPFEFRSYITGKEDHSASHAKETCDLIIPQTMQDALLKEIETLGFFDEAMAGIVEMIAVNNTVTYQGNHNRKA